MQIDSRTVGIASAAKASGLRNLTRGAGAGLELVTHAALLVSAASGLMALAGAKRAAPWRREEYSRRLPHNRLAAFAAEYRADGAR